MITEINHTELNLSKNENIYLESANVVSGHYGASSQAESPESIKFQIKNKINIQFQHKHSNRVIVVTDRL